jgi:aspartate-semialdehyde dehydrogenase
VVIDCSAVFGYDPLTPLVAVDVNPEEIEAFGQKNRLACPGALANTLACVLAPIEKQVGISRVFVSTYESVSGAGQKGVAELEKQTLSVFNLQKIQAERFPYQVAFNCLPQVGDFGALGATGSERRLVQETRKILHCPDLPLNACCVRVPVFYSHAQSVNLQTKLPLAPQELRDLLATLPCVSIEDNPGELEYPTSIDAAGRDEVLVGRIRIDDSQKNGLNLWLVADNVRFGVALNAVRIAENLVEYL